MSLQGYPAHPDTKVSLFIRLQVISAKKKRETKVNLEHAWKFPSKSTKTCMEMENESVNVILVHGLRW